MKDGVELTEYPKGAKEGSPRISPRLLDSSKPCKEKEKRIEVRCIRQVNQCIHSHSRFDAKQGRLNRGEQRSGANAFPVPFPHFPNGRERGTSTHFTTLQHNTQSARSVDHLPQAPSRSEEA